MSDKFCTFKEVNYLKLHFRWKPGENQLWRSYVQKYPFYALQHGHKSGGLFKRLSRFLVPIAKSLFKTSKIAKYAAHKGLQMVADIVKDILQEEY